MMGWQGIHFVRRSQIRLHLPVAEAFLGKKAKIEEVFSEI